MKRSSHRKKNKSKSAAARITFPITARQAQKLLKHPDRLVESPCGSYETTFRSLLSGSLHFYGNLNAKLASIASTNPDQIVIPKANNDDWCIEDYDYEDYDYEEGEADNLDSQYSPKGTDEVAPQSASPSDDAEMHGGDNASQEVEDGQAEGGQKQFSSENGSQSQNAGTDEGANGSGSGSRNCLDNREGCDADLSDRPETGFATSGDAAASANSQTPSHQTAGTSESAADSESGESTAMPPVSDPSGKTMPSEQKNFCPRDGKSEAETQENSDVCEGQVGRDNFNPEGQAKSLEDVESGEASQGQSGDLEDNQIDLLADGEPDWGDPNSEVEQVPDVPQNQKKWGKSFSKQERESGQLSASANSNHGGINATLARAGISPKLAKECQRKLAKLIGDATSEISPRRDYQEFCVRVKSFRNPNPARKEESGRPVILIMADVSGSCASFSDQSVMVAKAASKLGVSGSDVVVLAHSNGYPQELEHNGKAVEVGAIAECNRRGKHAHSIWYEALMQKYQVAVAIALGDWDAADDYLRIMQHPGCEKFIWLDNAHCTSRGFVKEETKMALDHLACYVGQVDKVRHKLTYKTGCKNAQAFVREIE